MNKRKTGLAVKIIAIFMVIVLVLPVGAMAAESRASLYLDAYSAYVYPAGWWKVQVWFSVDGNGYMDEIGSLAIQLYESTDNENWTWVKTFEFTEYPDMLGYNNYYHTGHIEYNGSFGKYYKAYVCVWAGKNGDGDTRYFWTNSEKATLFAG